MLSILKNMYSVDFHCCPKLAASFCHILPVGEPLVAQMVKRLPTVGDLGSTPLLGRSSGEGNGNPLQYSCLENPMAMGSQRARHD